MTQTTCSGCPVQQGTHKPAGAVHRIAEPAAQAVEPDLPDVEDMAHSAVQEALACGVSHDVFHRWMRSVLDKTVAALRAAPPAPAVAVPDARDHNITDEMIVLAWNAMRPSHRLRSIEAHEAAEMKAAISAALAATPAAQAVEPFQKRVQPWMQACFGPAISADTLERNHRFLEESLELVQSLGCTESEALQLVAYVYGRPWGETTQEVGGVMVTLAALCSANGLNMHAAGDVELARIWTKVEAIRAKQAAKPKHSPLPMHAPQAQDVQRDAFTHAELLELSSAADDFKEGCDTNVNHDLLARGAIAGFLYCECFSVINSQALDAAIAASAAKGGA